MRKSHRSSQPLSPGDEGKIALCGGNFPYGQHSIPPLWHIVYHKLFFSTIFFN